MNKYFFILLTLVISSNSFAQQDQKNWRIGAYGGVLNYFGDLNYNDKDPNENKSNVYADLDNFTYGLSLEKNLSKTWSLRLQYLNGEFTASDRSVDQKGNILTQNKNFNRALNVHTEINNTSLMLIYQLDNGIIMSKDAFLAPYFFGGLGWSNFKNYGDLFLENGDRYYYWSDGSIRSVEEASGETGQLIELDGIFETALSPLNTEGVDYELNTFHKTIGLGFKFRLSNSLNLNLESQFNFTDSDYLDDVSGKYPAATDNELQAYAAQPGIATGEYRGNSNSRNDKYSFTSASLHFNFHRKKEAFIVPYIRIGTLHDRGEQQAEDIIVIEEEVAPIISVEPLPSLPVKLDTQALYAVQVVIDSAYFVSSLADFNEEQFIDTILKIGNKIYYEGEAQDFSDFEEYEDYFEEFYDVQYDDSTMLTNALDTQIIYKINTSKDSLVVVTASDLAELDVPIIDTFYQVGYSFYADTIESPLAEEEWSLIRDNLLNIDLDELDELDEEDYTYENYVELVDSVLIEQERIIAKQDSLEAVPVLTNAAVVSDSIQGVAMEFEARQLRDSILAVQIQTEEKEPTIEKTPAEMQIQINNPENKDATEDRIQALERELLQMKKEQELQRQQADKEKLMNDLEQTRLALSEEKRKMQLKENKTAEEQKIEALNANMQKLQADLNAKNDVELQDLRKSLLKLEMEREQQTALQKENEKLRKELEKQNDKKPEVRIVPAPISNTPKDTTGASNLSMNNEFSKELAKTNESLESIKLLLAQQAYDSQTRPQTATNTAETLELIRLRAEMQEMKNSITQMNAATQPKPSLKTDEDYMLLEKEVANLKLQLAELEKPKVVEVPVEVVKVEPKAPVIIDEKAEARAAIAGKEKAIVFFAIGSSALTPESMNSLQNSIQLVARYNVLNVLLEGYTDPSGNPESNLRLSKRRVDSVRNYLINYGIPSNRIISDYRGEDANNDAAFGRRVELKLILK